MAKLLSSFTYLVLLLCLISLALHPMAENLDHANHQRFPGRLAGPSSLPNQFDVHDHSDDFLIPESGSAIPLSLFVLPLKIERFPLHLFSLPPPLPPPKAS